MKIHHVRYLTKDLRASEKAFLKLGYEVEFPAALILCVILPLLFYEMVTTG